MSAPDWAELNSTFLKKFIGLCPDVATSIGLYETGDKLPEPGVGARSDALACLKEWKESLDTVPREALQTDQLIDRQSVSDHLALMSFAAEEVDSRQHDTDALSELWLLLYAQLCDQGQEAPAKFAAVASRLRALPAHLETFRALVDRPYQLWHEQALKVASASSSLLDLAQGAAADAVPDEALVTEFAAAVDDARAALASHQQWLEGCSARDEQVPHCSVEIYQELCRRKQMLLDLADLMEFAEGELDEQRMELSRLTHRLGHGRSVEIVLAELRKSRPESFDEQVAMITLRVEAARTFLDEHQLCTLTDGDSVEVLAMPQALSQTLFGAHLLGASRATAPQTSALLVARAEQDGAATHAFAELTSIVIHDAFPGRHLFKVWSNSATSALRSGFPLGLYAPRMATWADELVEGWPLYCAEMMAEEGFTRTKAERAIIAAERVARAVRFLVDIDLNCGAMTVEQATERLVNEAFMSPRAARKEIVAMSRAPTCRLGALLGVQGLFNLRRGTKARWRNLFSLRLFHDLVLRSGAIPLRYLDGIVRQTQVQSTPG